MKLHRLTICNFRSFQSEQTFHFPEVPGLYFMQGVNAVEPRLEANGTGKTTIWEALTWLLKGKTSRGLKAGEVCNWEAGKGAWVELAFELNGAVSIQVMRRSWSPNAWTLTDLFGKVVDLTKPQEMDNKDLGGLGLDFLPFLHCVLMAQGMPMFLDLAAPQRATLFSEIMALDEWITYSERASKDAQACDRNIREAEQTLSNLRGRLESLDVESYELQSEVWEDKRQADVDKLQQAYDQLLLTHKKLKASPPTVAIESIRASLRALLVKEKDLQHERQDRGAAEAKATIDLDRCEQAEKQFGDLITFLDSHDHCPTCDQGIPAAVKQTKRRAAKQQLDAAAEMGNSIVTRLIAATSVIKEVEEAIALVQRKIRQTEEAIRDAEQTEIGWRRTLSQQNLELDRMEERAAELMAQKNPYADIQQQTQDKINDLHIEVARALRKIGHLHEHYSLLSGWARWFKEIRLQLIAEALTELEISVNNGVAALGLVDWGLTFHVDRENKAGGIVRGFSVGVRSPHNRAAVPWEAWSGGEAQRLRLATNMGVADLIRARTGVDLNLEVWDEPSNGLSEQGIQDLLEALAHRARTEQRIIWIVDHKAHAFGGFAGGATITKTEQGSIINQY